ncbi:MAG: hypothetical protein ACRD40_19605, partial [Candidatus Acidiferrales bacterium]
RTQYSRGIPQQSIALKPMDSDEGAVLMSQFAYSVSGAKKAACLGLKASLRGTVCSQLRGNARMNCDAWDASITLPLEDSRSG